MLYDIHMSEPTITSHPSTMFTVPSLARAGDYSKHHNG